MKRLAILVLLVGCAGAPAAAGPPALEVAEALRDGGLPITYDPTDTTSVMNDNDRRNGVVSQAMTASDAADISINVYDSADAVSRAKQRLAAAPDVGPFAEATAECSARGIFVWVADPTGLNEAAVQEQARQAQRVLDATYGPC